MALSKAYILEKTYQVFITKWRMNWALSSCQIIQTHVMAINQDFITEDGFFKISFKNKDREQENIYNVLYLVEPNHHLLLFSCVQQYLS